MNNNNLIDDQSLDVDFYEEVKTKNQTYMLWALFLMLVIAILYPISMVDDNQSALGRVMDSFVFTIVVFPTLAVYLGIPIALLPYKGLFLHQKYKRAFLLTLLSLDIALIVLLVFIGLYSLYDHMLS
jgi:hypothetical protein